MIRVFAGNNWFGIKTATNDVVEDFLSKNDSINIEKFYGPETSYKEVNASLNSISLFSENKLVIIEKLSAIQEITEEIDLFLSNVGDATDLVIQEPNIDKRSSYYKKLKKLEGFREFGELSDQTLEKWITDFTASNGGQISLLDARHLVNRVGTNQSNLETEIIKLVSYNKIITSETIDLNTLPTPKSTIFNLVESVFDRDIQKALRIYEEQRALRVEPQAIFGMLVWQMHIVAICVTAGSMNMRELAKETGINSYVLEKSKRIADRMNKEQITDCLDFLADIEAKSRQQTYNFDDAMKTIIARLSS